MAHGFLSYQNNIGESAIERRITKIVEDKLEDFGNKVVDSIGRRINNLFQKKEVDLTTEEVVVSEIQNQLTQGQTPLLTGGNAPTTPQSPLQRMFADSALAKTVLPGAIAANPSVMGGPLANAGFGGTPLRPEGFVGDRIVDISATSLGVERDFGGDDMFVKRLNTIDDGVGGGSQEVVQAIDRLTFVTMSLVAATKEQTNQQMMIAAQQEQTSEKLARQAKATAEENALEGGGDFSGNLAYEKSAQALGLGGSGGGGGGGGGGMFGAKALLGKAGRRGAERGLTRLGAGVGGKIAGKAGMKTGAKLGAKFGATTAGKMIGKKIPGLGLALGTGLAIQRMQEGKPIQALLEFASGAASTFPGIGTAVSLGLDGVIAGRDMGLIPFADGGIPTGQNVPALLNDRKDKVKEAVIPLNKKTFLQFGEGMLDAQRKNKKENAKRLAEGLAEYYDKRNGWQKFMEALENFIKDSPLGKFFNWTDASDNPPRNSEGRVLDTIDDIAGNVSPETTSEFASVLPEGRPVLNDKFLDRGGTHMGIDVGVDGGSKVNAVEAGVVEDIYPNYGKHGDAVVIKHADGTKNIYGHVDPSVAIGDKVEAGDTIARVKYWPTADGGDNTHLHMERVGTSGKKVDPAAYLNEKALEQAAIDNEKIAKDKEKKSFERSTVEASNLNNDESTAGKGKLVKIPGVGTVQRGRGWFGGSQMKFYKPDGTQINADEFNKLLEAEKQRLGVSGSMPDFDAGDPMTKPGEGDQSSITPSAADNGNALALASSQEVASAALAPTQSPIIQNFYGSDGKQGGGNQPAGVPFGISSRDTGTNAFSELGLRTLS